MVIKKQHPDVCSTYEGHPVPCLASFMPVTLLIHTPLSTDIPRISLIKTVTCVRNVTPRYIHKTTRAFRFYSTKTRLTSTMKNYLSFKQKMNRKKIVFLISGSSRPASGHFRPPIQPTGAISGAGSGRVINGP